MNSRVQVSYQPIIDIEFSGLHLIEASAGTRKTYRNIYRAKLLQQHSPVLPLPS